MLMGSRRDVVAAIIVLVTTTAAATAQDAGKGKFLYTSRCAFCHGATGAGNGPAAAGMKPPPTDFTRPQFWKSVTPSVLRDAIINGRPGTSMIAYRASLTAQQIDNVLAYVATFKPAH